MCGIAGVITWDEKYRVTRDTLAKMSRAIAHRGPDGEGIHLTRENEPITSDTPQIALAFRRLAILDPDPRANQPFHIGPLTLVFNGEIYNFRELRAELTQLRPDYAWRTSGDTEVLLLAYDVWREKCLDKLNGMFAFAVWDEQKKELFLARDRMGQKPLYVAQANAPAPIGTLAFASELGALRTLAWVRPDPHPSTIRQYLRYGYSRPSNSTFYTRTNDFSPGQWNRWASSRSVDGRAYFDPNGPVDSDVEPFTGTREALLEATRRQLVSDVPLGVFLSGGVDSSVIAACARQFGPVETFSIGFDDPRYDESNYAKAVADHLGTKHHQFTVRPSVADDLVKLAQVFGEPFADSSALPTHYLSRETRKHVKVALSGDGGDELFGGYDRYRAIGISARLARSPRAARTIAAAVARPWATGHPKSRSTRAARLLGSLVLADAPRYASYMRIFDDMTIDALLQTSEPGTPDPIAEHMRADLNSGLDPVEAALATDRVTYLPGDLLTKVDRASMLHGLEVRSPFMDHELVAFAASLSTDQLLKGGPKRMLREAFAKDLPDFVFKRKKMGFAVPIGEWFRGELRSMLRDSLFATDSFARTHFNMKVVERLVEEHETRRVDHSQRLYALLMLELWFAQSRNSDP